MPNVIIKGMEAPNTCYSCRLRKRNGMEILCPVLGKSFSVADVNILHYRLNDCPISPAPEWISVDERLPEQGEDTWIYTPESTEGYQVFADTLEGRRGHPGRWANGPEESRVFIRSGWLDSPGDNVTHWMPIMKPDPPEGGNNNGA